MLAIRTLGDVDIIEVPEYGAEGYFLHQLNIPVVVRLHTPMLLDHYRFSLQSFSKNNWHYYWQGKKELQEMKKLPICHHVVLRSKYGQNSMPE